MSRIIAGFAGSLRLAVPGSGTRPTSDRVREAIFSALESRDAIDGARVLDLYAGSGALGLEAASRGASRVTLVEKNSGAVKSCRANAALVQREAPEGWELAIDVVGQSVQTFLTGSAAEWDLVFLDPPYDLGQAELEAALTALAPRLAEDATVLLERSARTSAPALPPGLTLDKRKDYGDTALYWLLAG